MDRQDGNQDPTPWKLQSIDDNNIFNEVQESPFLFALIIGVGSLLVVLIIIVIMAFFKKEKTDMQDSVETGSDNEVDSLPPPAAAVA